MDALKIQISQLLSETTKNCDNIVITVLCVSVTKEISATLINKSSTYTANHIAHHLKETQNGKITYNKKEACIQVQLDFRMQALLSSPFI